MKKIVIAIISLVIIALIIGVICFFFNPIKTEKNNNTISAKNETQTNKEDIKKIEVTEDKLISYDEFKEELVKRGFIYDIPEDKYFLAGKTDIKALDAEKPMTGYSFTEVKDYDIDSSLLSSKTTKKFPFFIYDTYTSLIKKSDNTADYYTIGPEDWYITWYICYVNGSFYAIIGDESEYGKNWECSLAKTDYAIVVSEKNEDITIYNAEGNYFVEGGGILDNTSGYARYGYPETSDEFTEDCMKIRVVDELNAETLDKISKELSPEYWKVYKNEDSETDESSNNNTSNFDEQKYIGTWEDDNNSSELEIQSISNGKCAFSWAVYRLTSLDDTVISMKNNKGSFYFQGYDDKNFNSKADDGEHYYRKATISLNDDSITIKVEDIDEDDFDFSNEKHFDGQVYLESSTYKFKIK